MLNMKVPIIKFLPFDILMDPTNPFNKSFKVLRKFKRNFERNPDLSKKIGRTLSNAYPQSFKSLGRTQTTLQHFLPQDLSLRGLLHKT